MYQKIRGVAIQMHSLRPIGMKFGQDDRCETATINVAMRLQNFVFFVVFFSENARQSSTSSLTSSIVIE